MFFCSDYFKYSAKICIVRQHISIAPLLFNDFHHKGLNFEVMSTYVKGYSDELEIDISEILKFCMWDCSINE